MDKPLNRQEFLMSLSRGGLLMGLGGLGAMALHGSKDPSECFNENYCTSCDVYHGCTLPERIEVKDERESETRSA
jgi:hypothetical protein